MSQSHPQVAGRFKTLDVRSHRRARSRAHVYVGAAGDARGALALQRAHPSAAIQIISDRGSSPGFNSLTAILFFSSLVNVVFFVVVAQIKRLGGIVCKFYSMPSFCLYLLVCTCLYSKLNLKFDGYFSCFLAVKISL